MSFEVVIGDETLFTNYTWQNVSCVYPNDESYTVACISLAVHLALTTFSGTLAMQESSIHILV